MNLRRVLGAVVVVALIGAAAAANGFGAKPKPKIVSPPKLKAAVSGKGVVTLQDARGRAVTTLKPGWYTITIADDSRSLNFHIVGPGVDHATGVHFRGVELWGLHVRKGVYSYRSDPGSRHIRKFNVN